MVAPDYRMPFKLAVDASDVGAGDLMFQEDENGLDHPVSFFSKRFDKHQVNYCTIEKEGRRKNVLFNDALDTFYLQLYGVTRHMGYSFRLTAGVILYAPSYRQVITYHGLCHTSRGALA